MTDSRHLEARAPIAKQAEDGCLLSDEDILAAPTRGLAGRRRAGSATSTTGSRSPTRPRSSYPSRCSARTVAATAPSPSRLRASRTSSSPPNRCSPSPPPAPSRVPRGLVHPRRASRASLPDRRGVAGRARLRLDGRLPGRVLPPRHGRDRAARPLECRGPFRGRAVPAAHGGGEPGDDARVHSRPT